MRNKERGPDMLFVLLILCAVLARFFLVAESREEYVKAVILKGLASLCFVAIGLVCSPGNHIAGMIVAGLIIGSIADVLLNLRMVFEEKGQLIFLVGILVFLTGHINLRLRQRKSWCIWCHWSHRPQYFQYCNYGG